MTCGLDEPLTAITVATL